MSIDERIREGLRATNDALPMPDADRALAAVAADARRTQRRTLVVGLAAATAVVAVVAGGFAATRGGNDSQKPIGPSTPTPTPTSTESESETIPTGPSEELGVQVRAHGLRVSGDTVPGTWEVTDTRRDVWVAIKTDENDATSQWWGKGATAHAMPPSVGDILRGGVVISKDARWIVWTRPASDVNGKNPPRVMEVVDTTTGKVRWSRNADADAPEVGALAVTNDGVVTFGHCLEPVFDSEGWPQCADARVDVWAPQADVIGTVPADVTVSHSPFDDTVSYLGPLVQRTGAHNGLLVQRARTARPQYVRVSDRADVEVVATLPRNTVAVTADERFALLAEECSTGPFGCGDLSVLPLDGGERRPIPSLEGVPGPQGDYSYRFVVERDDLLLVQEPFDGDAARCSLAQARCVPVRK